MNATCDKCEIGIIAHYLDFMVIVQTHRPDSGTPVKHDRYRPYTIVLNSEELPDDVKALLVGNPIQYVREKKIIKPNSAEEEVWSIEIIGHGMDDVPVKKVARQWIPYFKQHGNLYDKLLEVL